MLDDLKMIHRLDAQDALGIAEKQPSQLKHKFEASVEKLRAAKIENIIVGGMGGSALAAELAAAWPKLSVPYEIIKGYGLPPYADSKTLFIASSYSGNTEETLSALASAEEKGCQIVAISSGGELGGAAREKGYPFFSLPSGFQPRMAVFYNFAALIQLFSELGFFASKSELAEAADWLSAQTKPFLPDEPTKNNLAKQLALELVGSSIVVYSGPMLAPAAYKWKINFNENAKNIAWQGTLPEFNHNEFLGWTSHPVDKPYKVVDLRSALEHPRVQKRFLVTEKLLSGRRPAPEVVEARGDSALKQLLWTVQLGDFVSLYLALLNGLNPTPVDLIEKLKDELDS